jgi:phosphate transport system permease protein
MRTASLRSQGVAFGLFRVSAWGTASLLAVTLLLLLIAGSDALSWRFLTASWRHVDITQGGIFPAIVGSLYLGLGVLAVSFPLGIGTAIYLTEYGKGGTLNRLIQLAIRNLAGVPSVVYGLFGLAAFVHLLNLGASLAAASLTLSAMTLPWIITSSVEALEAVPERFRESSMALGATRWQTVRRVIMPSAISGCITGGIVGMARALGETAPIIIVGATFFLARLPTSPLDRFMALPYHAFILSTQHSSPHAQAYAAATGFVLIILTFILSAGAIALRLVYRRRKDW